MLVSNRSAADPAKDPSRFPTIFPAFERCDERVFFFFDFFLVVTFLVGSLMVSFRGFLEVFLSFLTVSVFLAASDSNVAVAVFFCSCLIGLYCSYLACLLLVYSTLNSGEDYEMQ